MAETAQQQVLNSLRDAIVRREFLPGMPIRAAAVAERFGVSRIPVREALRVLEAEGLVSATPHKGVVVAEMSPADLHEIYLLRQILENEAARRAIPALSRTTLAELDRLVAEMDAHLGDGDHAKLVELNRKFHFTICEASGLTHLTRIVGTLWNQSDAYRALYLAHEDFRRQAQDEHRAILEACHARDVEAAVELLDEHRRRAELAITKVLVAPDPSGKHAIADFRSS
jgi:DNA-binding GntR family transcriptional regulator